MDKAEKIILQCIIVGLIKTEMRSEPVKCNSIVNVSS